MGRTNFTIMRKIAVLLLSALVVFSSCKKDDELSAETIVAGLKEALKVGTDTAVTRLSKKDGFYSNAALKILLPEEAAPIVDVVGQVPLLSGVIDEAVLAINRAAEDAAVEAKPIFVNAITSMTIADGLEILNGNDTAATAYLRANTETELYNAFKPKIETSLSKEIVGNVSAESAYKKVIDTYNFAVLLMEDRKQITTNSLSEHTTRRALRGLFKKVGEEETLIRRDPAHRVTELLKDVFSEQD